MIILIIIAAAKASINSFQHQITSQGQRCRQRPVLFSHCWIRGLFRGGAGRRGSGESSGAKHLFSFAFFLFSFFTLFIFFSSHFSSPSSNSFLYLAPLPLSSTCLTIQYTCTPCARYNTLQLYIEQSRQVDC